MNYDSNKKIRILLLEDDPESKKLILHTLEERESPYDVETIQREKDLIEYLFREGKYSDSTISPRPDLILLNINILEMGGETIQRKLLMEPETRNIPLIFLVSGDQPESRIKSIQAGLDEYIMIPFEGNQFIARIEAVLARRRRYLEMSRTDPLTQILNREAFELEITRELKRITRYNDIASLVFINIDDFKKINEEYGETVGDLVLVRFGDILRKQARDVDVIGRYSGEEFVVFFPRTDAYNAKIAVSRILVRFKELSFGMKKLFLSFSAGIAETPESGTDFNTLCTNSQNAMIKAKEEGKAQIVIFKKSSNKG